MRPERLLLSDMMSAIGHVKSFIADMTFDEFNADEKTKSAVLFQLVVIGEAAAGLPDAFRSAHPEMEWGPVIGFPNRVVHGYFAIDWSIVWNAATRNIAELEPAIARLAVDSPSR